MLEACPGTKEPVPLVLVGVSMILAAAILSSSRLPALPTLSISFGYMYVRGKDLFMLMQYVCI